MKKLDEIEAGAKRSILEKSEGSIHYRTPAFVSPEDALGMVGALRELLAYASDPNEPHDESCSYITTYNSKSLDCDCWKYQIREKIARHMGEEIT